MKQDDLEQLRELMDVRDYYLAFEPRSEEEQRIVDILFNRYCASMPKRLNQFMENLVFAAHVDERAKEYGKQYVAIKELAPVFGMTEEALERRIQRWREEPDKLK